MEGSSHRACANCRSQKTRCIPDESNPDICQRCVRFGRECVFTTIQKRRKRRRTDMRVAELEKEMNAMRSLLKQKDSKASAPNANSNAVAAPRDVAEVGSIPGGMGRGYEQDVADLSSGQTWAQGRSGVSQLRAAASQQSPAVVVKCDGSSRRNRPDVIDKGLLSMEFAHELFQVYRNDLFVHYPVVYMPPEHRLEVLRETKPSLFLAILAAASGKDHPSLAAKLDQEVLQEYANRIVVNSGKTLELVQSLLVSAVWFQPPTELAQLKFYEYIHMAATMAMDIGIGERPKNKPTIAALNISELRRPSDKTTSPDPGLEDGTDSIECRRTLLGAHATAAISTFSLRRPAMIRVTNYLRESLEHLLKSDQRAPSDRAVRSGTNILMITHEICTSFAYDDLDGIASILDVKTQIMIGVFRERLTAWREDVADADLTPNLLMSYYSTRLFLHEVALHLDYPPEDFQPPFQMDIIQPSDGADVPVKAVTEAVLDLMDSSHALIEAFLSMDANSARALPVFSYVRLSYATFVLAKLSLSSHSPQSRLTGFIDTYRLNAVGYMDRTIGHLREVIGPMGCRTPAIILRLLFKLRRWCTHTEFLQQATLDHAQRPLDAGSTDALVRSVGTAFIETPEGLRGSADANYDSIASNEAMKHARTQALPNQMVGKADSSWSPQLDTMDWNNEMLTFMGDNSLPELALSGLDDWLGEAANFPLTQGTSF